MDESHLHWGDVCGYVWGPKQERITVTVVNEREQQTYYGAINPLTDAVCYMEADTGNSTWTTHFLEALRRASKEQRIIVCWDGASYHRSKEIHAYLDDVNAGKERTEWPVTCLRFAPYAPTQNPIEDIWLRAKSHLREHCRRCGDTFSQVKSIFDEGMHKIDSFFDKLYMYTSHLQLV